MLKSFKHEETNQSTKKMLICTIGTEDRKLMDSMIRTVLHERWYKVDKFTGENLSIARVHSGILNPESQPILNKDKSILVFLDGEIFDLDDPKKIISLYKEHGEEFIKKLDGSFVVVILDLKEKKLLVMNDRYALRPIYYWKVPGKEKLLLASEVKAIIEDPKFEKRIDKKAIAEFFAFGHLLGDRTFFSNIKALPPASILTWRNGNVLMKKYWDLAYDEESTIRDEEYCVKHLAKLFKDSVRKRIEGGAGISFSGGPDSGCVIAAVPEDERKKVTAIHYYVSPHCKKIVKEICEGFGIECKIIREDWETLAEEYVEEGHYFNDIYITDGMSRIPHFNIHRLKETPCNILLTGWEPETTLKATYLHSEIPTCKNDEELSMALFKRCLRLNYTDEDAFNVFSPRIREKMKNYAYKSIKEEIKKQENELPKNKSDCFFFKNRQMRYYIMGFVRERTYHEDRMPFRDYHFLDFVLKIPPDLRRGHRIYTEFVNELSPSMASLLKIRSSWFYKLSRLMKASLKRIAEFVSLKSHGLIRIPIEYEGPDLDQLIRDHNELRKWIEEILLDDKTLNREIFDRNFIEKMYNDHMNYKKNYSSIIFSIINFELWYRMFMEGTEPYPIKN